MYRLEREDFLKSPLIFLWAVLGFQAGFINAFGFLACGRYVSHVTGIGTQIGLSIAESQVQIALELVGFPLSFMFGAFFSGVFTSARLERGHRPRYDLMTFFMPVIIMVVGVMGWQGFFGDFGETLTRTRDFILLFTLSFACGLQNGCFASLTKGQIRTTHLTGISTDLGTDTARLLFGKLNRTERNLVVRANLSRAATFVAFSVGSILSVFATEHFHYAALIVPFVSALMVAFSIMWVQFTINEVAKGHVKA
jgi:uncharacterized membrane protein YoaK (UPF0700 family)